MQEIVQDRPPIELLAPVLMKSVGISLKRDGNKVKFVFKDKKTIDDLAQLGFSIDILRVNGGEMPLPVLAEHIDNQSSLEAYWGARAEKARFELMSEHDSFQYWFDAKYAVCFNELQDMGVPKPIQKEVEARISRKFGKELKIRKEKVRVLEFNYRMLHNACFTSIATKGKMMQSLRNIIQGVRDKYTLDAEVIDNTDLTKMRIVGT